MCFTCEPASVVDCGPFRVVYTRVADELTMPTDMDLPDVEVESFRRGEWGYVGLCATVMWRGRPLVTQTLFGVPERGEAGCAFRNELAVGWVTCEVLDRAGERLGVDTGSAAL